MIRKKMECKSCGFAGWIGEETIEYCPECGSNDLEFESLPEIVPKAISKPVSVPTSEPTKDPLGLRLSKPSPVQKHSGSGSGLGMSNGTIIRIILGIVGLIMVLSALGMFMSGMTGGYFGGFTTIIVLAVIGVIFLAIATKGDICDC